MDRASLFGRFWTRIRCSFSAGGTLSKVSRGGSMAGESLVVELPKAVAESFVGVS